MSRMIIVDFDTPTEDKDNEYNDIHAITSLASDARNAGRGRGGGSGNCHCHLPWVLAIEPLPPLATSDGTKVF